MHQNAGRYLANAPEKERKEFDAILYSSDKRIVMRVRMTSTTHACEIDRARLISASWRTPSRQIPNRADDP